MFLGQRFQEKNRQKRLNKKKETLFCLQILQKKLLKTLLSLRKLLQISITDNKNTNNKKQPNYLHIDQHYSLQRHPSR